MNITIKRVSLKHGCGEVNIIITVRFSVSRGVKKIYREGLLHLKRSSHRESRKQVYISFVDGCRTNRWDAADTCVFMGLNAVLEEAPMPPMPIGDWYTVVPSKCLTEALDCMVIEGVPMDEEMGMTGPELEPEADAAAACAAAS